MSEQPKSERNSQRFLFVNAMRVYAMTVVVLIHVASLPAPHFNTITPYEWWVANVFHVFSKGGPPLFTMISGMLLLGSGKNETIGQFFSKRFARVLGPFVIWATLYLFWRLYFNKETLDASQIWNAYLVGPMYYHLWFIQMILGLYIATPILRLYVRQATQRDLSYFLTVWVVSVAILPLLDRFFDFKIGIEIFVTTGYVGYYIFGYYLRDVWLSNRQIYLALTVAVVAMVFTEWATYLLMLDGGGVFDPYFLNYYSINMIINVGALFLVLKSLPYEAWFERFPRGRDAVILLSSCSFGIYFVHVMIMELLGSRQLGFELTPLAFNPLLAIPLTTFITFTLSFGVTLILKRIPIVRFIVP